MPGSPPESEDRYAIFSKYLAQDMEKARLRLESFDRNVKRTQQCGAAAAVGGVTLCKLNPAAAAKVLASTGTLLSLEVG